MKIKTLVAYTTTHLLKQSELSKYFNITLVQRSYELDIDYWVSIKASETSSYVKLLVHVRTKFVYIRFGVLWNVRQRIRYDIVQVYKSYAVIDIPIGIIKLQKLTFSSWLKFDLIPLYQKLIAFGFSCILPWDLASCQIKRILTAANSKPMRKYPLGFELIRDLNFLLR